jgi:hypothetical protein
MLMKRHYFASWMALASVFSEILIIAVGVLPYAPGQIKIEMLIAHYFCFSVLGIMILTVIYLMFWKQRLPDLPRAPDTVAALITYLSESKMLGDFEGLEYADDRELANKIAGSGKRYVYGKMAGMDGEQRFLVDEDSMTVHGDNI